MRLRFFARVSVGVMAWALVAVPLSAQGSLPDSCVTASLDGKWSNWEVEVVEGPCPVSCADNLDGQTIECNSGFDCTGIVYEINGAGKSLELDESIKDGGSTDRSTIATKGGGGKGVVILARGPVPPGFGGNGIEVYPPCVGFSTFLELGEGSCHEQAILYTPPRGNPDGFRFAVVVEGARDIATTAIGIKQSKKEFCEILGFGRQIPDSCVPSCGNFNANQTITRKEILDFKGCKLEFIFDLASGAIVDVDLVEGAPEDCDFLELGVDELTLNVPDIQGGKNSNTKTSIPLGGTFGDGLISVGTDSCSCRVIGGRVYCWGLRCPN